MTAASDYFENAVLDHCLDNDTPAGATFPPATCYLALLSAAANDASTGATMSEITTAGLYARQAIVWGAAAAGVISNSSDITYATADANYSDPVTHWAIMNTSAINTGDILVYGAFDASKTITNGDQFIVSATNLQITLT